MKWYLVAWFLTVGTVDDWRPAQTQAPVIGWGPREMGSYEQCMDRMGKANILNKDLPIRFTCEIIKDPSKMWI